MNKKRRGDIAVAKSMIGAVIERVKDIRAEEEFAFDGMPDNLQSSTRGEESQEAIECMDNAVDSLEEALDYLEDII